MFFRKYIKKVVSLYRKTKITNNMNTEKYSISFLDELDNIELANTFVEKLPQKDQKRLEYILNHEEEYSDSDYWDELRNLVYKNFGTTDTLMFARGIEWDIDEEDIDEVSLPEDADVWVPEGKDIADVLTDMYGFCIKSIESVEEM